MTPRKRIVCILISIITLVLASCALNDNSDEYKTPNELAEEMQTQIMTCFINNDRETLKSFFSEYILNSDTNIDAQIEEALYYIDGKIVSYDDPFSSASGGSDRKNYGAYTENIITDKGTEYRIAFDGYLTNSDEPDKVGVKYIKIVNMSIEYDDSKSDKENGILYIGERE